MHGRFLQSPVSQSRIYRCVCTRVQKIEIQVHTRSSMGITSRLLLVNDIVFALDTYKNIVRCRLFIVSDIAIASDNYICMTTTIAFDHYTTYAA